MPEVKLDHCVIHVSDWERSNAFYRDVLGAELVQAGAGWSYRFGDQQLNLHGGSDLCFVWPGDIEEAQEHLGRCGIEVEMGPVERRTAILDFAVKITERPLDCDPEDLARLKGFGLTEEEVWDIVEIASMYNFTNRMSLACGMIPNEEYHALAR